MNLVPILAGLAFSSTAPLQASSGSEGASFLDIPVGAAPAAMGSAYSALATDAYAPVWNPAGLGFLTETQMAGQHLSYLESINYEYLSVVRPIAEPPGSTNHSGLGFSAQYLRSGDIPQTDASGSSLGQFSSRWGSYNLSYGRTLSDKLSLGLTGKWINAAIADVSANAFAVDLGSLYKLNDKINLAATLTNFGTKLTFLNDGDSLPLAGHFGIAYRPDPLWLLSSEVVFRQSGVHSFHIGGQWRPLDAVSLRVGYKTDTLSGLSPVAGFTMGVGIHAWGQEFAYAWSPYGDLGDAQYFSLLIHFGPRADASRNLVFIPGAQKVRTVKAHADADDPETKQLLELLSDDNTKVVQPTKR